jgi:hypothetical protein
MRKKEAGMGSDLERFTGVARGRLARAGWDVSVAGAEETLTLCRAFAAGWLALPRRGLLLSGTFGCGKTMAARAIYTYTLGEEHQGDNLYFGSAVFDLYDPAVVQRLEEPPDMRPGYVFGYNTKRGTVVLDDMGAEPVINFRKDKDFVGDYIIRRHRYWLVGYTGAIAVTTNLTGEEMAERYGGRVMSRLMEMVVPVRMTGGDRRRRITL